jgi:hypothetical protein
MKALRCRRPGTPGTGPARMRCTSQPRLSSCVRSSSRNATPQPRRFYESRRERCIRHVQRRNSPVTFSLRTVFVSRNTVKA